MILKKTAFALGLVSALSFSNAMAYPSGFPKVPKHERKEVTKVLNKAMATGAGTVEGGVSTPCAVVMCLSPYIGNGTTGGPSCTAYNQIYFNIRVYDPWSGYDPGLTQAVRGVFLNMCSSPENSGFASAENSAVGAAFDAP